LRCRTSFPLTHFAVVLLSPKTSVVSGRFSFDSAPACCPPLPYLPFFLPCLLRRTFFFFPLLSVWRCDAALFPFAKPSIFRQQAFFSLSAAPFLNLPRPATLFSASFSRQRKFFSFFSFCTHLPFFFSQSDILLFCSAMIFLSRSGLFFPSDARRPSFFRQVEFRNHASNPHVSPSSCQKSYTGPFSSPSTFMNQLANPPLSLLRSAYFSPLPPKREDCATVPPLLLVRTSLPPS